MITKRQMQKNDVTDLHIGKLPTFKGYTVDARLHEFRKWEYGKLPETIPFTSEQGRALLIEYIADIDNEPCEA